jgi:4-hydroxybenzoate polyprenyltransferase
VQANVPASRRLGAYLALTRPAGCAAAAADVAAGVAITAPGGAGRAPLLLAAGVLLYAGGAVLNDVFDAGRDARERPERPIPSERASAPVAAALGVGLLAAGCSAAHAAGALSGLLALTIAAGAVAYDGLAGDSPLLGPLTMGSCRALNLLLGMSGAPHLLAQRWPLAAIPLVFVAALTAFGRAGPVRGRRRVALATLLVLAAVELALGALPLAGRGQPPLAPLVLVALLAGWTLLPVGGACWRPAEREARFGETAVVLGLVLLDSALAATYAGPMAAGPPLALLLVSAVLTRTPAFV